MFTSSLELTYGISTNPNPIQVSSDNSPRTADIEIVFSNNSSSAICLQELDIEIPVGDNAQELTADATGIQYQVTPNGTPSPIWDISLNGGTVSLTSHTGTPVSITRAGFAIQLSDIKVNEVLGTCYLSLTETTGTTDKDKKVNTGQFQCGKFPDTFSWSNFEAVDNAGAIISKPVNPGTSIWLAWEANVIPNATLSLYYDQQDIDVTQYYDAAGSNQYHYPKMDETGIQINNDDITFTLQVNYKIPDGTVLQSAYQYTVSVIQLAKIENFEITNERSAANIIWLGETVTIKWATNDATAYCQLFRNGVQIKEPSEGEFSKHDVTYTDNPSCSSTYRLVAYNNSKVGDDSREDTSVQVYEWQTLSSIPISFPSDIAITSDSAYAYVTSTTVTNPIFKLGGGIQNSLSVINIATNTVLKNPTPLGDVNFNRGFAPGLAIIPKNNNAFVANTMFSPIDNHKQGCNFSVADASNTKVLSSFVQPTIPLEKFPSDISILPDGKHAYIANFGNDSISEIDITKQPFIPVGKSPFSLKFTPISMAIDFSIDQNWSYVTSTASIVYEFPYNMNKSLWGNNVFQNLREYTGIKADMKYYWSVDAIPGGSVTFILGSSQEISGQQTNYLYVQHFGSDSGKPDQDAVVITLESSSSADQLPYIPGSIVAFNSKYAYVTSAILSNNDYMGKVYVLDIAANTASTLVELEKSQYPAGIAIRQDGDNLYAYVTNIDLSNVTNSSVSVIDINNKKIVSESAISLTGLIPISIKITPDWKTLYVLNINSNRFPTITLIDIATNKILPSIPEPKPWDIAITSDGTYAYVTNAGANNVFRVNISQNKVLDTIPVGQFPSGIVIDSDDKYAYVTNMGDDSVSVIEISTNTNTVVDTLKLNVGSLPTGIAITKLNNQEFVYITNTGTNSVSVINVANKTVSPPIQVGMSPIDIAITSDSQYAFVTNFGDNDVSMIDIATSTVIPTSITVEQSPTSIAISPDDQCICVANAGSHSVSVFQRVKIPAPNSPSKPAVVFPVLQNRVTESGILEREFQTSTASRDLLFTFKSKPTDKQVKDLQNWLTSIAAMGNWQIERIAKTLRIKFELTDMRKNEKLEKKLSNTLLHYLRELPEWKDVGRTEQEGSNLFIHCRQDNSDQSEQVLREVLGIQKTFQTKFCTVS